MTVQNQIRRPFWRSRLWGIAMLTLVTAAVIVCFVTRIRSFTVVDGDARYVVSTFSDDPAHVVEMVGVTVGEHDAISRIGGYNELVIDRFFPVTVMAAGKETTVYMTGGSVGNALEEAGVDIDDYRLIDLQYTDSVSDGMRILLKEPLTYEERTEREPVPYQSRVEYTTELPVGRSFLSQKGEEGEILRVWRDTLDEGEVISSVLLTEKVTQPVEEVRRIGTKVGSPMSPAPFPIELDEIGQPVHYKELITKNCTAYTNDRGLCAQTTSLGWKAEVGVVAVNPHVIPYGTKLYIVSPDGSYVYGYARAGDTGGACMAGRIICDLFMETYEECCIFGRRPMNVYILE